MKPLAYVIPALLFTQTSFWTPTGKDEIVLDCQLMACERVDSLYLFEFNGVNFSAIQSTTTTDWQNYQFRIPASQPRFYYVGASANNLKPLILGIEKSIALKGSCAQFQSATLPNSALNQEYEVLKATINEHKTKLSNYLKQLQTANAQENIELANSAIISMKALDEERLELINNLKKTNPFLSKIAAINTYLSYHNHGTSDETELDYFATRSFQLVDWNDPDLAYNPWVYESTRDWTQTLCRVNLPNDQVKHFLDLHLSQIPASRTHTLALGGVIAGLQNAKSPLLKDYIARYIAQYKATQPAAVAQLEQLLRSTAGTEEGAEAPDFTMNQPDGTPLSLSDLRGKVLLVDFWASWCGPCRRENPNVVKAYQKYREKGFDVLGVSLDKDQKRWLDAIEKDGLVWNHVSDLTGWANGAAQLYGVRSIPHTILLDRNGKIIARNLRGAALDAKLEELFGE